MKLLRSHGDSLLYLSFTFFNAILYTSIKYLSNITGMKTLAIAGYMNIGVFILYNIFFGKRIFKERLYQNLFKMRNFIFISSALSALVKMYVIQYIQPRDATVITHGSPFIIMIFAFFFLNEVIKIKDIMCIILSMIGLIVYVSAKFESNAIYYGILFLHVIFKAVQHVAIRNVGKASVFHAMFYDNLFLSIFATFYFTFVSKVEFAPQMLLDIKMLAIIAVTTISLFSLVKSYSIASGGISRLQNLDFSKVLFTFILGVIFLDRDVQTREIIGGCIIMMSMFVSQVRSVNIFKMFAKNEK